MTDSQEDKGSEGADDLGDSTLDCAIVPDPFASSDDDADEDGDESSEDDSEAGDGEEGSSDGFDAESEFRDLEGRVLTRREMAGVARDIQRHLGHVSSVQRDQSGLKTTVDQLGSQLEAQQELNAALIQALGPSLDESARTSLTALITKQGQTDAIAQARREFREEQDADKTDKGVSDEPVLDRTHPDVIRANNAVMRHMDRNGVALSDLPDGVATEIEEDARGDYEQAADWLIEEVDKVVAARKTADTGREERKAAGQKQKGVTKSGGGGVPSLAALAKLADGDAVSEQVRGMNDDQFFALMEANKTK